MRWFRRRRPAPVLQPLPKRLYTAQECAMRDSLRQWLADWNKRAGDES